MSDNAKPIRVGLLLTDGFALLGYAALVEALRGANALSGRQLYDWVHVAPGGLAVEASNGARVVAEARVGEPFDGQRLFVFAGGDPSRFADPATFGWLRRLQRRGTVLGGVSGGPYLLARAGLLAGRRATIHWEYLPMLREDFPDIVPEPGLYVIDGPIITCAGGMAAMDLALALIAQDHGADLARRVGEWFVQSRPRAGSGPQRPGLGERHGATSRALITTLDWLEHNLERRITRTGLAQLAGLSVRQLDRLCMAQLGRSLAETVMAMRLEAAAHRLRATDIGIAAIAIDCGFASAAHFSRRFRAHYGQSPAQWRLRPEPYPQK